VGRGTKGGEGGLKWLKRAMKGKEENQEGMKREP